MGAVTAPGTAEKSKDRSVVGVVLLNEPVAKGRSRAKFRLIVKRMRPRVFGALRAKMEFNELTTCQGDWVAISRTSGKHGQSRIGRAIYGDLADHAIAAIQVAQQTMSGDARGSARIGHHLIHGPVQLPLRIFFLKIAPRLTFGGFLRLAGNDGKRHAQQHEQHQQADYRNQYDATSGMGMKLLHQNHHCLFGKSVMPS